MTQEEGPPIEQGNLAKLVPKKPLQRLQEATRKILLKPQVDILPEANPTFEKLEVVTQVSKKDSKQMTISELTDVGRVKNLIEKRTHLLQSEKPVTKELDRINEELSKFDSQYVEEVPLIIELEGKKPLELMQIKLSVPQEIKELAEQIEQRRKEKYYESHSQEVNIDRRQLESLIMRQRIVDDLLRRLDSGFLVELTDDLKPKSS